MKELEDRRKDRKKIKIKLKSKGKRKRGKKNRIEREGRNTKVKENNERAN